MQHVVLDTNVIISALVFGGVPRTLFRLCLTKDIIGVTSPLLLAECADVLTKKFDFESKMVERIVNKIKRQFTIVYPAVHLDILDDDTDNRVLEAAVAGSCDLIITGDKDLLKLGKYRSIHILRPAEAQSKV